MKLLLQFLTLCILLNTTYTKAQVDVSTNIGSPVQLKLNGNDLYIVEFGGEKISKVDITASLPTTATTIIGNLQGPVGMAIKGNFLYYSLPFLHTIAKIDLTLANPTQIVVLANEGLSIPYCLDFHGNDLYIANYLNNEVLKIDVTAATPTATTVVSNITSPYGLKIDGNDLYVSSVEDEKIYKVDLTATTLTATEYATSSGYTTQIDVSGNKIYLAQYFDETVSTIDMTDTTHTVSTLLSYDTDNATDPLEGGPYGVAINGNDMYVAELVNGKISKHSTTLSINEFTYNSNTSLYPNPSREEIKIKGLTTTEKYNIYNTIGQVIMSGNITNNKSINVRNLKSGVYFLKIENKNTLKFIKS